MQNGNGKISLLKELMFLRQNSQVESTQSLAWMQKETLRFAANTMAAQFANTSRWIGWRMKFGFLFSLLIAVPAAVADLSIHEDQKAFVLSNETITARVEKGTGNLVSLKFSNTECMAAPGGYWSQVGKSDDGGAISKLGTTRTASILSRGPERVVVSLKFRPDGKTPCLPCDVELRYSLGATDSGIHAQAIWTHGPGMQGFSVGEARYAMKLSGPVFDYLAIEDSLQLEMPTGADWDAGTQLNMKEVRRLNTGKFIGRVEHKYDYAAVLPSLDAYGWAGTKSQIGLWMINPSHEYLAGGPTKVDLTGHLDVGARSTPTLLNMWHGSHYGGSSYVVAKDEVCQRVIGPMFIYVNSAKPPRDLWKEASEKAKTEQAKWPFEWAGETTIRSSATGKLTISEKNLRPAQVGLVAMPYKANGTLVEWQRDSKFPQFWSKADTNGNFSINHVLPGTYRLVAIADGVLGEFTKDNVTVIEGKDLALGKLEWQPVRHGKMIWEIGIPDRSAAEFRHGDDFRHWGLNAVYAKEFPTDVDFTIGKSDWKKDWNYAQPARLLEGNKVAPTTWKIRFTLPEPPQSNATLRMGFAGSRLTHGLDVIANGKRIETLSLPETGTMHRDGIRGLWTERSVTIPSSALKAAENLIELRLNAPRSWVEGVLYDYLRLEM